MRLALGRLKGNWLTGGAHAVIVFVAAQFESREVWPFALALMALVSFFAWMANYHRFRQVHDLPTSKVASCAQGYAELFGRAEQIANTPLTSPLSSRPCCWYRYQIDRRTSDNKWREEESGESVAHFLLADDTGECVISPEGAEILYPRCEQWTEGDRRYTEELILPESVLYALGEFSTSTGVAPEFDRKKAVSHLLGEWKKDMKYLVQRFDANRDGKVDLREWEAARLEAQRHVAKEHADLRGNAGLHLLGKPRDGRVFILASAIPAMIGRRFAMWSWGHLAFFFVSGAASYLMFAGAPH
jgi:hypothetical protein